MTYLQFVLLFLVAPAALLVALHGTTGADRLFRVAGAVVGVGLVYALPFEYLRASLAGRDFDADKVLASVLDVPVEQVLFIVFQVCFTGTLAAIALRRSWWRD
jgi:hypothetical protein